jgi:hypothetical protein
LRHVFGGIDFCRILESILRWKFKPHFFNADKS